MDPDDLPPLDPDGGMGPTVPGGGFFDNVETMFSLVSGFVVVFIVVVTALVIWGLLKQVGRRVSDNAAPEVTAVAEVVDKRIQLSGGGESAVTEDHFVSFEQAGGERFELQVPAGEYGLLVVGDRGSVTMKGTRYLGFAREILR